MASPFHDTTRPWVVNELDCTSDERFCVLFYLESELIVVFETGTNIKKMDGT